MDPEARFVFVFCDNVFLCFKVSTLWWDPEARSVTVCWWSEMIYVGSAPAQLVTDRTNLFTYMLMQILMVMMMVEMVRDVSFGPHFGHNEFFLVQTLFVFDTIFAD